MERFWHQWQLILQLMTVYEQLPQRSQYYRAYLVVTRWACIQSTPVRRVTHQGYVNIHFDVPQDVQVCIKCDVQLFMIGGMVSVLKTHQQQSPVNIVGRLTSCRSQRTLAIVCTLSWPCCQQSLWYSSSVSKEKATDGSTGAHPSIPRRINDTLAGSSGLWCIPYRRSWASSEILDHAQTWNWTKLRESINHSDFKYRTTVIYCGWLLAYSVFPLHVCLDKGGHLVGPILVQCSQLSAPMIEKDLLTTSTMSDKYKIRICRQSEHNN